MKINFLERRSFITFVIFCVSLIVVGFVITLFFLIKELPPAPVPTAVLDEKVEPITVPIPSTRTIGQSVEKRDIVAHSFGTGTTEILFVGGVHGGYEWNSVLLAEAMIEHFTNIEDTLPPSLKITIIPVLNPDGLALVANGKTANLHPSDITNWSSDGRGRFNAQSVDLNRNFDCKWQPNATWRGKTTSAGTSAFSEPEAASLRDYVLTAKPVAVVFWHSVAGAVYASECENGILPQTLAMMDSYAEAGKYRAVRVFDAYPVTGDAEGWLASIGIPAITVELETRESIEWTRNLAGVNALLKLFTDQE